MTTNLEQIRSSFSVNELEKTLAELQTMIGNVQEWARPAFQRLIDACEYRIEKLTDWASD